MVCIRISPSSLVIISPLYSVMMEFGLKHRLARRPNPRSAVLTVSTPMLYACPDLVHSAFMRALRSANGRFWHFARPTLQLVSSHSYIICRFTQLSSQPVSGSQLQSECSTCLIFFHTAAASSLKMSKEVSRRTRDYGTRKSLLLVNFFQSGGFGCPDGSGENTSNGNLKSKYACWSSKSFPLANIGRGRMELTFFRGLVDVDESFDFGLSSEKSCPRKRP